MHKRVRVWIRILCVGVYLNAKEVEIKNQRFVFYSFLELYSSSKQYILHTNDIALIEFYMRNRCRF